MITPERAFLAIADISGYTSYLAGVELDHAQDILSDLTVTVVEGMGPFQLLKLEGDAAFCYVPGESMDGSLLQDAIESTYMAFRRRLRDIKQASTCECDACVRIPDLDLKMVVHHGTIGRQRLMGLEELVGSDVILVHRLLKNEVREATGIGAYALYTQAAIEAAAIDAVAQELVEHRERIDVPGEVVTWVRDLEAAWQRSLARPRLDIPPERRGITWRIEFAATPQFVFEFLTAPARRPLWDASIDSISEDSVAGRRGPETVNHCMHGKDAIVEQILDWRPAEYQMTRTTLPGGEGAPQILKTESLSRTPEGHTQVELTIGSVEGRTPEQDAPIFEMLKANFEGAISRLRDAIDAAAADVQADVPEPPPLPERKGRFISQPVVY